MFFVNKAALPGLALPNEINSLQRSGLLQRQRESFDQKRDCLPAKFSAPAEHSQAQSLHHAFPGLRRGWTAVSQTFDLTGQRVAAKIERVLHYDRKHNGACKKKKCRFSESGRGENPISQQISWPGRYNRGAGRGWP